MEAGGKRHDAIQIDKRRAARVELHLRARRKKGRKFVSGWAFHCGYGAPSVEGAEENIVTRNDILEQVSKELRGTPAQGSAGAIGDSYKAVKRGRKRKRRKRGGK